VDATLTDPIEAAAVVFDFYGTLGESEWQGDWLGELLSARAVRYDRAVARRYATDAWDGKEHVEHSVDEATYRAWRRVRMRAMLEELGAVEGDLDDLVGAIDERLSSFRMVAYPESARVLRALRDDGLTIAVCSNWDWDLREQLAVCGLDGLVDIVVSSAWAGARKPHPRVFEAVLRELDVEPECVVFVGDNWEADVEGPRALGMRPVHVWRHDEHPGDWLPEPPPAPPDVPRVPDLRPLPSMVTRAARAAPRR
jgi:putative hydrolase of the HAD superfamily